MITAPDQDTVTRLLRAHVDPRATCTGITRSAAGNSQETWMLAIGGIPAPESLVLRRSAAAGTLEWSDRATEVAALGAAAAVGLPVPRVWWWEPDGGTLDRAYLVMDTADGAAPRLGDPAVAATAAASIGRWLARLHAAGGIPAGMPATAAPVRAATLAELTRWRERAAATGLAPALLGAICDRLAADVPDDAAEATLLWGDPGPHNVLTDAAGEVTALLDWELAQVGHPLLDLGAARWACLGHLDREILTTSYEQEVGSSVDRGTLGWFEALACVTRSVMLLDGVRAALDGRADDPNVLALGTALLAASLLRGAALVWGDAVLGGDRSATEPGRATRLRPTAAERDAVLSRFLTRVASNPGDDARSRRGLKIAAALLACPDPGASPEAASDDPHRLVAGMLAAYRAQQPLLDLYGATTSISGR